MSCDLGYHENVASSGNVYYNDIENNQKLINDISNVLNGQIVGSEKRNVGHKSIHDKYETKNRSEKSSIHLRTILFVKSKIRSLAIKLARPILCLLQKKLTQIVFEGDKQFNHIFPYINRFVNMPYKIYEPDTLVRKKIKNQFDL